MSNVPPFSSTYQPQSVYKILDSTLQHVRLNPSITDAEPGKQSAPTVQKISQVHRKAAGTIEESNDKTLNQKQNICTERQEPKSSRSRKLKVKLKAKFKSRFTQLRRIIAAGAGPALPAAARLETGHAEAH